MVRKYFNYHPYHTISFCRAILIFMAHICARCPSLFPLGDPPRALFPKHYFKRGGLFVFPLGALSLISLISLSTGERQLAITPPDFHI